MSNKKFPKRISSFSVYSNIFSSHFRNKLGSLSDNLNSCAVSYSGLIPSNLHFDFSFYTSKTEPVCIRLQLSNKAATQSIPQVQQNGKVMIKINKKELLILYLVQLALFMPIWTLESFLFLEYLVILVGPYPTRIKRGVCLINQRLWRVGTYRIIWFISLVGVYYGLFPVHGWNSEEMVIG